MSITLRNGKPAIEVKDRTPYHARPGFTELYDAVGERIADEEYENLVWAFWNLYAPEIAEEYGYGAVYSEGRSDGWLVVENPPNLDLAGENPDADGYHDNYVDEANEAAKAWEAFEAQIHALMDNLSETYPARLQERLQELADEAAEAQEMAARGIVTVQS